MKWVYLILGIPAGLILLLLHLRALYYARHYRRFNPRWGYWQGLWEAITDIFTGWGR